MTSVVAIVEGEGELEAARILLRRFLGDRLIYKIKCTTIRAHHGSMLADHNAATRRGIEYYIDRALVFDPAAILILLDADDVCLDRGKKRQPPLGPWLQQRAQVASPVPTLVVVANREYEVWFLNAWSRIYPDRPQEFPNVENIRDCKGHVSKLLGRRYEPTTDQARLSQALPFDTVLGDTSRSYRRLLSVLEQIAQIAQEAS